VKSLVEAGAGVSLVPRAAVRAHLESGRLVALRFEGKPLPAWQVHLSARREPRPEPVDALAAALRAALPTEG
jgi:DNA-binding transcriptional LysR family regulator